MTTTSFAELPLSAAMLANLSSLGYQQMTEIQAASLPYVLEGRDLIAQAKTGSGKTAAFGLGLLHRLNPTLLSPQALVMCPTRELAEQVAQELRRLARCMENIKILTLCGGKTMGPQIHSLTHGAHIIVGTPGRIGDHLERGTLDTRRIHTLVLDEADRMTDMGFYDDMAYIVKQCPPTYRRQTLLFSATYPDDIREASAAFLKDPVEVKVEARHDNQQIEQRFYRVAPNQRMEAVATLLTWFRPESALAFCNTKARCEEVAAHLREHGLTALALHGDLEQRDRDRILVQFANRSCTVLVATDVAARGLDIDKLAAVINVEACRDPDVYIHRIGRTGRGSESGLAINLCSEKEQRWVEQIEQYQKRKAERFELSEVHNDHEGYAPPMVCINLQGGKKDKLRPGDLLGALTVGAGLSKEQVGKIHLFTFATYVAVTPDAAHRALAFLSDNPVKGKRFRVRILGVDEPTSDTALTE